MQIDDAGLYAVVHDAYDDMGPSDEAMARMFANIQRQANQLQTNRPARIVSYQDAKRKSRMKWEIVGSLAACLVVLAGVGAFVLSQTGPGSNGDPFSNMFSFVANDVAQGEAENNGDANGNIAATNENQAANENNGGDLEGNGDEPQTQQTATATVTTTAGEELELVAKDENSLVEADSSLVGDEVAVGTISLAPLESINEGGSCVVYNYGGSDGDYAVEVQTSDGQSKLFVAVVKPSEPSAISKDVDSEGAAAGQASVGEAPSDPAAPKTASTEADAASPISHTESVEEGEATKR